MGFALKGRFYSMMLIDQFIRLRVNRLLAGFRRREGILYLLDKPPHYTDWG